MEFSTEMVKKMAAVMIQEMEQLGMVEGGIRDIETTCARYCGK